MPVIKPKIERIGISKYGVENLCNLGDWREIGLVMEDRDTVIWTFRPKPKVTVQLLLAHHFRRLPWALIPHISEQFFNAVLSWPKQESFYVEFLIQHSSILAVFMGQLPFTFTTRFRIRFPIRTVFISETTSTSDSF
jgi:hypothetical protein